jgi:excisionase family DNA binding protein
MKLLTVKETCERLRISRATLYNLVRGGKLTFVKIGGKSLMSEEAIERFITQAARTAPTRTARTEEETWAVSWDELVRRGLVDSASRRAFLAPKFSDFRPVKAKGKLASEIIIEERGER